MAKIEQRDALAVLTKPPLRAITDAVGLDLVARELADISGRKR